MYTYILLDMDDTIFDFQKAQSLCFRDVLSYYNEVFTAEKYKKYNEINHSLWRSVENQTMRREEVQRQRFTAFFAEFGRTILGEEANNIFQDSLAKQSWLMPHAAEVCKLLSRNHQLVIVTNGLTNTQYHRVKNSEVSCYFSEIIVSEAVGIEKPNEEFYRKAFDLLHFYDTRKMLVVGDSLTSDIKGANNAGIDSCWYNPNKLSPTSDNHATYTISSLTELLSIVSEQV